MELSSGLVFSVILVIKEFQKQMDSVDLKCSYKFDPDGVQVKGETIVIVFRIFHFKGLNPFSKSLSIWMHWNWITCRTTISSCQINSVFSKNIQSWPRYWDRYHCFRISRVHHDSIRPTIQRPRKSFLFNIFRSIKPKFTTTLKDVLLGSQVVIDFRNIASIEDFYIDQCYAHNMQITEGVKDDSYYEVFLVEDGCPADNNKISVVAPSGLLAGDGQSLTFNQFAFVKPGTTIPNNEIDKCSQVLIVSMLVLLSSSNVISNWVYNQIVTSVANEVSKKVVKQLR